MSEVDRVALQLIDLLYQAPADPPVWLRFLDALRAAISEDVITLFAAQPLATHPGVLAGSGIGVAQIDATEFLRPSTRHPTPAELPAGSVIEVPFENPFGKSRLYREFLEPAGVLPGPGFITIIERTESLVIAAGLVLPRSKRWKPRERDRALLERVAPHLVNGRRLHLRRVMHSRDGEALLSAADHLLLAMLFVDENGRVSYANQSAAELLGVSPGFAEPATLASKFPDERTRAWQRLLKSEQGGAPNALVYAHPEDGRPLQVIGTPFGWNEQEGISAARFARAVFVCDPKRLAGDPVPVLRDLYGLTQSETRLALLLLADCSVEEAAKLLGITVGTARGVLKTIFAKTGTNRQASLVRLLLAGPPGQLRG
jgi:DNA-binding CsgD family transcriptional regulator